MGLGFASAALLLHDSDYAEVEGDPAASQGEADTPAQGVLVGEEGGGRQGAEHDGQRLAVHVSVGYEAPFGNLQAADPWVLGGGPDYWHLEVVGPGDGLGVEVDLGDHAGDAVDLRLRDGLGVAVGQGQRRAEPASWARLSLPRDARLHEDEVCAQSPYAVHHVLLRPLPDRDQHDHRADADHQSQGRQGAAKPVGKDGPDGYVESGEEVQEDTPSGSATAESSTIWPSLMVMVRSA